MGGEPKPREASELTPALHQEPFPDIETAAKAPLSTLWASRGRTLGMKARRGRWLTMDRDGTIPGKGGWCT